MPVFALYEMLPQLALQVRKTSKQAATNSTLGVLALNVLGQGGIGERWQTGGLNATTNLECTADAPLPCPDGDCATVWLQSNDCAVLNATHVSLVGKTLAPSVAQLQISVTPRSLRERRYSFSLHVPVWNGSGWRFASIDARLDVHAVADARLSEVWAISASDPARPNDEPVLNHLERFEIQIAARDGDGALINRTGERIAVHFVSSNGRVNRTELAQYNPTRAVYFVRVTIAQPGGHAVLIETDAAGGQVRKALIRVECVYGYTDVGGECIQSMDAATKRDIILASIFGALLLGFLGLLGHLIRAHRDRWRVFLVSFLKHEGVLTLKVLGELWDISGTPEHPPCEHLGGPGWSTS